MPIIQIKWNIIEKIISKNIISKTFVIIIFIFTVDFLLVKLINDF